MNNACAPAQRELRGVENQLALLESVITDTISCCDRLKEWLEPVSLDKELLNESQGKVSPEMCNLARRICTMTEGVRLINAKVNLMTDSLDLK